MSRSAFLITVSSDEGAEAAFNISILYLILFCWVNLAIQIKRWHDRDKSGWMVLINFIPILGLLWPFVELGFLQGSTGPNRYGNDPLQSIEKENETEEVAYECSDCGVIVNKNDKICHKCGGNLEKEIDI